MWIHLNEYVHENIKIQLQSGVFKVLYEPFENQFLHNLSGEIYIDQDRSQSFDINEERDIIISPSNNKKLVVDGYFILDEGIVVLYWNMDPGDHFLCVSYEYGDVQKKYLKMRKINWSQEGF
jgi:hypothetical protein